MMKLSAEGRLKLAMKMACAVGAGVATNAYSEEAAPGDSATQLEKVEVTGTRIKRVDIETSNPVFVLDRGAIERSGVQTLGQLVQRVPAMVGDATTTNPQANNGGGTGATTVSLRGLGVARTLILLDGRRVITNDLNAVPINVVDRVEILKEGASAVYGSDAIGGVVNIITQRDKRDGDFTTDYGVSSKHDGRRRDFSLAYGLGGDKGHALFGFNYNQQDQIPATNRSFSSQALYLYSGVVTAAGSPSNPLGRYDLPPDGQVPGEAPGTTFQSFYGCPLTSGEILVSRKPGAAGSSPSDYTCYTTAGFAFNFQAVGNVIMTPQTRWGTFLSGSYDVNRHVSVFAEAFHNFTHSKSQLAPVPIQSTLDDITIAADNPYNPFGVQFGGLNAALNARMRFLALGPRTFDEQTITDQVNVGIKGSEFGWHWEAVFGYGRIDSIERGSHYLSAVKLREEVSNDCGTPADPACLPLNYFNLPESVPGAVDALNVHFENSQIQQRTTGEFNVSGPLAQLPAGALSLAAGIGYRMDVLNVYPDFNAELDPASFPNLSCALPQDLCQAATNGHIRGTDYYAELLIPVLADMPAVKVLNLSLSDRVSDYQSFGGTNTFSASLEYRPTGDLLTRASWAQVYRIPTVEDLFQPGLANAPTFNDPCVGLDEPVGTNPNHDLACENVPRNGSFEQAAGQITGVVTGNPDLKPEKGNVLTFGFVYDPDYLPGFSTTVDFWRYRITDNIIDVGSLGLGIDPNVVGNLCYNTGDPTLCSLIHRDSSGQINFISAPAFNIGTQEHDGVDVGFKYNPKKFKVGDVDIGRFRATLDMTYLHKFDVTYPNTPTQHVAGSFDRQYGTFPRWQGIASVGWEGFGLDALITERYLGAFAFTDEHGDPHTYLQYHDTFYTNLEVGYTVPWTNTRLAVGVDNIKDITPPILYFNNVINANTDTNTFDTVGRYFWFRLTQRF